MNKQFLMLTTLFTLIICACNRSSRYPYAIKDFRASLQPHLTQMVALGIVGPAESTFRKMVTDGELIQLGQSEHPILRAAAFREMGNRKSFRQSEILNGNLSDTALIATDAGEFGIWFKTVADDILDNAVWKTHTEREKVVETVLTKHNYLESAHHVLHKLEPQEKYYKWIKEMATRPLKGGDDGFEIGFGQLEYALYGLAKFKKQQDIPIIKTKLLKHAWELSDVSLLLMTQFPDTAYFDILQHYHRVRFYRFSGNRPHGFSGVIAADKAAPEDFIDALVMQKSESSARLLDTMLMRLPKEKFMPDNEGILNYLILKSWAQDCPAYKAIRQKIRLKAEQMLKDNFSIPEHRFPSAKDTSGDVFHWRG